MPRPLAIAVFVAFILWLFVRDVKRRQGRVSSALWIPLLWLLILGSRPVSLWIGLGVPISSPDDYAEGSPLDRLVFLSLMAAGVMVLWRRGLTLGRFAVLNRWVLLFFLYWGVSVLWSDYSFVSFKRWVKDAGNLVMVLVILTEEDPVEALTAVFARCSYILIPLSVLFIKYVPELGRRYHRWTFQPSVTGVTIEKNALGSLALVCGIFLVWELLQMRKTGRISKTELLGPGILLVMIAWLLKVAQSVTALLCAAIGLLALICMQARSTRGNLRVVEVLVGAALGVAVLFHAGFGFGGNVVGGLGRDSTLTGRTEIWEMVLKAKTDPMIGTGFYSFWLTKKGEEVAESFLGINQSHNGFLETYLNGGLLGLGALLLMLGSSYWAARRDFLANIPYGELRLTFVIVTIVYNMTEAVFNRLSLIWFVFIAVAVNCLGLVRREAVVPALGQADPERDELNGATSLPV